MKEATITTAFKKYIEANPPHWPTIYELKIEKTNRFSLKKIKDHQLISMANCLKQGFSHKISDAPIFSGNKTRFTYQKPCDYVYIPTEYIQAYFPICFYIPRKRKIIYMLSFSKVIELLEEGKKSITSEEAAMHASKIINLNKQ